MTLDDPIPDDTNSNRSPGSSAFDKFARFAAKGLDSLIERFDAAAEILLTPIVRFGWTLVVGLARGIWLVFGGPGPRTGWVIGLKRHAFLLRVAFSTYGDALGSLLVLTFVATILSAPLAALVTSSASLIPAGTPAGHPLAMLIARSLAELAFYYPLLTLGAATLALQRRRGEPILPSRCLHAMHSNFLSLIRLQASVAAFPAFVLVAAVAASLEMPEPLAIVVLGLASVASYGWIVRRSFLALTMAFEERSSDHRPSRRLSNSDFALFTIILFGTWTIRFGLNWLLGSSPGECLCWDNAWNSAGAWNRWLYCLSHRAGDALACLVLTHLFWGRPATRWVGSLTGVPEGSSR